MSNSYELPKVILRYEGVFDFKKLYNHIINWFKQRNYTYVEKGWKEKEATPQGREITVKMVPEKFVTEYIKYEWSVEWKNVDAHPVTVGDDEQMHSRFHLHVQATVIEDYQNLGKNTPKLAEFFNDIIFKRERETQYIGPLEMEMQELLDEVKDQLHMQTTQHHGRV